jgi:hypothetical protein
MKTKTIDIAVLILLPILATAISLLFHPIMLTTSFLFFGMPAFYLVLRNPGIVGKSALYAFIVSIPSSLFIDTLAAADGSWIVTHTIFPFKFFGLATVEVYIYGFLWVLLSTLFYEHFFDRGKKQDKVSKRIKYFLYIFGAIVLSVLLAYVLGFNLIIPYFYIIVGLSMVIAPLVIFLIMYPKFTTRFLLVACYFFYLMLEILNNRIAHLIR